MLRNRIERAERENSVRILFGGGGNGRPLLVDEDLFGRYVNTDPRVLCTRCYEPSQGQFHLCTGCSDAERANHPLRVLNAEVCCIHCSRTLPSVEFEVLNAEQLETSCRDCSKIPNRKQARTAEKWARAKRTCIKCLTEKSRDEFYQGSGTSICDKCRLKGNAIWRANNVESRAEAHRKWWRANPDKVLAREQRRRARLTGARRVDFTLEQWRETLDWFDQRCAYCLKPAERLEQDHVEALSRGGDHTADNIVPACRQCNARKMDRPVFLMARFL